MKEFLSKGANATSDDGIDDAFEVVAEINETAVSGIWLKACFFYLTNQNRLSYVVKDKVMSYAFLEKSCQILGYMPTQGVLFLIDSANKIISYEVPVNFPSAITHIAEDNFDELAGDLEKIENQKFHDKIAKYLEVIDKMEQAFQIVKNPEVKFEYALKLEYLEEAHEIAFKSGSKNSLKQIGDLCLQKGDFERAEEAFRQAEDFSSLFLLYSSLGRIELCSGDKDGIEWLASESLKNHAYTISFNCFFITRQVDRCVETLVLTKNFPEAAFFAKTYCPSHISEIVKGWKEYLVKSHPIVCNMRFSQPNR